MIISSQNLFLACNLLSNHMIFLVQFGINQQSPSLIALRLTQRARAISSSMKKFTSVYLFQIALKSCDTNNQNIDM